MSQGPLCPNLSQKVQKEVSQMANRNLPIAMLYRWFKCKLKPPKNQNYFHFYYYYYVLKLEIKTVRIFVYRMEFDKTLSMQ